MTAIKHQDTNKRKILIVDDDRLILTTLSKGLQQAGFEIHQATSGREALLIAEEQAIDLAILDVRMPNMSGIELAKLLRINTIPFMFLSAFSDVDTVKQAAENGAVGYLVKPVDIPQIVPAIEAGLARAAEIKNLRKTQTDLSIALESGRETSVALGLLMERYRINRDTAFETLRSHARTHRRKVSDVAVDLINAAEVLNLAQTKL